MDLLIKNGQVISHENQLIPVQLWIRNKTIYAIGKVFDEQYFDQVIDAKNQLVTQGLVDVHVHLREPGFAYKETIQTGSQAASRGGFTTICAMPNLNPVPDTLERFVQVQEIINQDAINHVLQYAPITKNLRSEELVDQVTLKKAGAFAFTNDGNGVQTAKTMYLAMKEAAENNHTIVAHTEDESLLFNGVMHEGQKARELGLPGIMSATESSQIARDLLLAEQTGAHYHVCHVSSKESVRVIRQAKDAGVHVTCEVCPHHLLLADEDITQNHGYWKMNPPLRAKEDQEALINGLLDGTIDCIATDHAPHSFVEKNQDFLDSPFGIVGSEYAFQLIYTTFVKEGIFTLEQVINWMAIKPAEIFGLTVNRLNIGDKADLAIFDIEHPYTVDEKRFLSQAKNTPFIGKELFGDTLYTLVDGKIVWQGETL
ncbi:dihydroorotase [Tetragenococcus muriaticus]|uniref:Dihydroorotase n=1 Tax=Tetragenococcus muriaticus 3MR10-3 TaxID=1302648 RepID=A0A091C4N6_9ENTE|nr:dihydroorotase [Tetragenococcus muriaticus]KFN91072.1 dihydroorotase [Tetragenococcus muriaticus 3MR10-3]GMA47161.1 dihydroorotase [Tetragenococcus muriaticus]